MVEDYPRYLVMSPISAAIVLAMAAYGSRGETENQFKQVLHLPSSESLGTSGYQALIDTLNVNINFYSVCFKLLLHFLFLQINLISRYIILVYMFYYRISRKINLNLQTKSLWLNNFL